MDGEDLDRLGVGFEPARPFVLGILAGGIGGSLGEPAAERGHAEALAAGHAVQ